MIAQGQPIRSGVQFANRAHGNRAKRAVENVYFRIGNGASDGNRTAGVEMLVHFVPGCEGRVFGGAVTVDQMRGRIGGQDGCHHGSIRDFTAENEMAQR